MPGSRIDQYRRWFEYEKDSHRKVMASFETVPSSQDDSPPPRRAARHHGARGRGAADVAVPGWGSRPSAPRTSPPPASGSASWRISSRSWKRGWDGYLRRLTDDQLDRAIEVQEPGRGVASAARWRTSWPSSSGTRGTIAGRSRRR